MKKINRIIALTIMAALITAALCACSSAPAETTKAADEQKTTETTTAAPVETQVPEETTTAIELQVIGSEDNAAGQFEIVNNTGDDIIFLALIKDGQEEKNLLKDGDTFKVNERRIMYYPAEDADQGDGAEVMSYPEYKLIFSVKSLPDSKSTLSAFPVGDADGISIEYDEVSFLPYLTYKSVTTGADISTLETELAIARARAEEESRLAEEAARAAEESRAAEEAAMYSFDDDSYNDGGYDDYYDGGYDDYEGDAEDGCIEDGLFF